MDVTDLITLLEGAVEGSRELDAEIIRVLVPNCKISDDGDHFSTPSAGSPIQTYTTSVDASLSLLGENARYSIYRRTEGFTVALAGAAKSATKPTLPLAICIAALRARREG